MWKPGNDEIAKGLTGNQRPVDAVDSVDGRTMLHSAVLAGDVEAVRFFVKNGQGMCVTGTGRCRCGAHCSTGTRVYAAAHRRMEGGWLKKEDKNCNISSGGKDLLCWLRGLPKEDQPLGCTDELVRHMEAGFRVVCKRLLEDMRGRREAAGRWRCTVVSVGEFGCGASLHRFMEIMGEWKLWPAVGCFRAFVWHLSLSVVAAREHLWRSSLRGVGGDSGVCGWRQWCCGFAKQCFVVWGSSPIHKAWLSWQCGCIAARVGREECGAEPGHNMRTGTTHQPL